MRIQKLLLISLVILVTITYWQKSVSADTTAPSLIVTQIVSEEPLLGGNVRYQLNFANQGTTPVTDKGYNLTITDTLPVGVSYLSATPAPMSIKLQSDGTTQLVWDNIADLELNETLSIDLTASINPNLIPPASFANQITAAFNRAPDNSGSYVTANNTVVSPLQMIDIEAKARQSTADEQATGAGEYDGSADWPYQYQVTVKNNNVGSTKNVQAFVTLPAGVAYKGNPAISPNPNRSNVNPTLALQEDGSLRLSWSLGDFTTAQYNTPILITFDTAIPYRYRTTDDRSAESGAFVGPMSGEIIPEDAVMLVEYEATGTYNNLRTSDGSQSTPADDQPVKVTAETMTVNKTASPNIVGIGTKIDYQLSYAVSEYYAHTNVTLTDILPDGLSYVRGSASAEPSSIHTDKPQKGQTTIIWELSADATLRGASGKITFQAVVDAKYEYGNLANQPIVSGDSFTNEVTLNSNWEDQISEKRSGTAIPDVSRATVNTSLPTFRKQVWNPLTNQWSSSAEGFTGDTMRFRLQFEAVSNIDAKEIVVRDFLPRGISFVTKSDLYTNSGTFTSGNSCTAAPTVPTIGNLNGLQYLEWKLCNVTKASKWQVEISALIADTLGAQPNWIVANFGKLSGQNSYAKAYSLRELATVDYVAPKITLTKSADPNRNLQAGSEINYTLNLTNNGRATAYKLIVEDTLPANLLVVNSGGSSSPTGTAYTTLSGNPSTGAGGVIRWTTIPSLAVGKTIQLIYKAKIPAGVVAGQSMTNLASVGYNSRSDNKGHQENKNSDVSADNTDEATVYVRGVTLSKTADKPLATIGETVRWTLTGSVPTGVIAYWPVVEENDLPDGFDFVVGSTQLSNVTLDNANHRLNPLDNGDKDLRWFLQTIDNSKGTQPYTFQLIFDTIVTGRTRTQPTQLYYKANCCLANADNDAFIGWYDKASGYNGQGFASESFNKQIDRRSPEADGDVTIRQPLMTLTKGVDQAELSADGVVTFTLLAANMGNSEAFDLVVEDKLPEGLTLLATASTRIIYPIGFPSVGTKLSDANSVGAQSLRYDLDVLYVGAVLEIVYTARVDSAISADLTLSNIATITSYSSLRGTQANERTYSGPTASVELSTPMGSIAKSDQVDEVTQGATIVYTLTVPSTPIDATLYEVIVHDEVPSQLSLQSVTGGVFTNNSVEAIFDAIPPHEQREIVITALVKEESKVGEKVVNQATLHYLNGNPMVSNEIIHTIVAPALVVEKSAEPVIVEIGNIVTYTLDIANVGSGRAEKLILSEALPDTLSLIVGSVTLNGEKFDNPTDGQWQLPLLSADSQAIVQFQALVNKAEAGVGYVNKINVTGVNSMGRGIIPDLSQQISADTDPDDSATATIYGPLSCKTTNTNVAYEDLKQMGWADWDYNDVIVRMAIEQCVTPSSELAVMKIDYELRSRGAGFDHQFLHTLPLVGGGNTRLQLDDATGNRLSEVNRRIVKPTFSIFGRTKEALPAPAQLPYPFTNTLPEQKSYAKSQHAQLRVVLDTPAQNNVAKMPPIPFDPYLFVYETGKEIHLMIPGHTDNSQKVNKNYDPTTPLLGYDLPLATTFSADWQWPVEFVGLWRGYPQYVNYIQSGKTSHKDWDSSANANQSWLWQYGNGRSVQELTPLDKEVISRYYARPVVGSWNGKQEIAIGDWVSNRLNLFDSQKQLIWSAEVGGGIKGNVALADLDSDGSNELIVGSADGKLYAFHHDSTAVAGWPITLTTHRILATPTIANLDSDPEVEILIPTTEGNLYALENDGTIKWQASLGMVNDEFDSQISNSSATVADVDGNGTLEIAIGSYSHTLYLFSADGSELWHFDTEDAILGTPIMADIVPDHEGLEIAFGSADASDGYPRSYLYLIANVGSLLWKQFAGWEMIQASPTTADLDRDGSLELIVGSLDGTVQAWHHNGSPVAGWPLDTGASVSASAVWADATGDGQPELLVANEAGQLSGWNGDGSKSEDLGYSAESSFKSAPTVSDLNGDGTMEIVAADFSGNLYIWGASAETVTTYQAFLPIMIK